MELRGLEPLTSSMPWWPEKRGRWAASVVGMRGRAGPAALRQPWSPSVCPTPLGPQLAEDGRVGGVSWN